MTLDCIIDKQSVLANVKARNKKQLLQELSQALSAIVAVDHRIIFETLLKREKLGSTGIGQGIAIPHGKVPSLNRVYGLFARLSQPVDFDSVDTVGISRIIAADIAQARTLGYVIRLIGMAEPETGADGSISLFQRVQPCLLPDGHPLAHVDGATNAVVAEGNFSGRLLFQGAGAGDGPTASAVVADLIDIARLWDSEGELDPPFSVPVAELRPAGRAESGYRLGRRYIRFAVNDRPGVLAEIAAAMRDAGVSIESLIQKGQHAEGGEVMISLVTHECPESRVAQALQLLRDSESLTAPPLVMQLLAE